MAGDTVRFGAHILVAPLPVGHFAMLAHPFGQFRDALWGGSRGNAFEQFAAKALATRIAGVGNEILGDFLCGGGVQTGVVAEMLVQFSHHALP